MAIFPVNTLVFSGFGDDGQLRFYSPTGEDLGQPPANPTVGTYGACNGMGTLGEGSIFFEGYANRDGIAAQGPRIYAPDFLTYIDTDTAAVPGTSGTTDGGCCDGLGNSYWTANTGSTPGVTKILKVTEDGVITVEQTVTNLVASKPLSNIGVNQAGTVAYLLDDIRTNGATRTCLRVDLSTGATTTFATTTQIASGYGGARLIVLSDDTVIIGWGDKTAAGVPTRYDTDGAVLTTYPGLPNTYHSATGFALVYVTGEDVAALDPLYFVINYYSDAAGYGNTIATVATETGDVEASFAPDDGDFEFDGAFTGLRVAITNLIEPPIRWLRRTPHAVNELKRVFYKRLDLLLDTGVGGASDPTLYMRYSNDGGQTWNTAKPARYGSATQVNKRVYWAPLGSGRDRVFEVYGDDPAPIRIVDAYIDVTPGQS